MAVFPIRQQFRSDMGYYIYIYNIYYSNWMSLDIVIVFRYKNLYPQAHNDNRFRSKGVIRPWQRGFYHQWFDTSGGWLLIQISIIRLVSSISASIWFIMYNYYWNLQFLYTCNAIKLKQNTTRSERFHN